MKRGPLITRRQPDWSAVGFAIVGGGGFAVLGLALMATDHPAGIGPLLLGILVAMVASTAAPGESLELGERLIHRRWWGTRSYDYSDIIAIQQREIPDRRSDGTVVHMAWRYLVDFADGHRLQFESTWTHGAQAAAEIDDRRPQHT